MIKAEAHSDDHAFEVEFDAAPWFEQAGNKEVYALARCGWGGDYPADAVADFMRDRVAELTDMFKYLEAVAFKRDNPGFECHVDETQAMEWLKFHRPDLFCNIKQEE